jgi:endonuclease/exonuclease/phosphatase family metal-dependent hydrolase
VPALDVLTFNVWGLPWPLSAHRRRRFDGIVEHLSVRADHIVGLQEVWGTSWRQLPLPSLRRAHRSRDSGLAIGGLLAHGTQPEVRHFRRASGADALKSKGVLAAEVSVAGVGTVRVLVTHLQAGRKAATVRAHQVDEILEEAGRSSLPTLLLGDFNLHDDAAEDRATEARLVAEGFADSAVQARAEEPTWEPETRYARGQHLAQRFDRIYARGSAAVIVRTTDAAVLKPENPLSDHHPVWARVVLELR